MGMHENDFADTGHTAPTDWAGSCRLALVVSMVAAVVALLLSRVVDETTLIVSVIVVSSAVSWFHLEHRPAADALRR